MPNFIPNKPTPLFQKPPFFEDIKAADVPGRRTEKKVSVLQGEVVEALVKLGAIGVYFLDGTFDGSPKRYGFAVHFTLQGIPARIDIAALPLRSDANKDRALAQALFLLRNRLEAQYYAAAYEPGLIPLLPYLIGPDGRIAFITGGSVTLERTDFAGEPPTLPQQFTVGELVEVPGGVIVAEVSAEQ